MKRTILLIAAATLLTAGVAEAKKKKEAEVDPLALARLLLKDGFPKRAMAALEEVKIEDGKVDAAEYHRVRGLAEFELTLYREAAADFRAALAAGDASPATHYSLASALFGNKDPDGAIEALRAAPPAIWEHPGPYRVQASAYYLRGNKHAAFAAIDRGARKFPEDVELERQRVRLMIDLGLYQSGLEAAQRFLQKAEAEAKDYLATATALASAKQLERAALLLEQGILRFPEDDSIRRQLARTYYELERPLSAAGVLYPVALVDSTAALHAAELFRRAGQYERALHMSSLVVDQKEKIRQRLNLLIELERYEEAAALDDRLARLGLLEDEHIAYALAYAHYLAGNRARVEQLLKRISDPELFQKAVVIRRAMDACAEDVWQCDL